MKREIKDHTIENIDEIGYKHNHYSTTLYVFYQFIKKENFIVIYADSYLEAKALLYSINPYADYVYNLNEYKLQRVDPYKLFSICKIAPEWEFTPTFVNKKEYKKLQKYIIGKEYSNINYAKVLTKKLAGGLSCKNTNKYLTTNEFVNYLKTNAEDNKHIKEQIEDYLINNSIILKTKIVTSWKFFDLYTNSENQTQFIIDKLREYDPNIHADYSIYNKKFIIDTDINSIKNYKELIEQLNKDEENPEFKDIKTPFVIFEDKYFKKWNIIKKED